MIKFCVMQWDKNKNRLQEALKDDCSLNSCNYLYLVKKVVELVLNDEKAENSYEYEKWDFDRITEINDGDYQGTLLFLIPRRTYQPGAGEYLMTYSYYGSCSGRDALQAIQDWGDNPPTEAQLRDYMSLCLHLIENMIMPYNKGFSHSTDFDEVDF